VYYAPQMDANYFFYDGMYWVYESDNWYASSWYNGPWSLVNPDAVPLFVLRVPVRYYRQAPSYFRGWRQDAPPRWGEHWGNDWSQRHGGWDRWNRNAVRVRPPLPTYQRNYSGERYPRPEQQGQLHSQNYRYQPREPAVRQHYQEQRMPQQQQDGRRGNANQPQSSPSNAQRDPRGPVQAPGNTQRRDEERRVDPAAGRGNSQPDRSQKPGQDNERERGDRNDKGDRRKD
jgi:hypothetical protein